MDAECEIFKAAKVREIEFSELKRLRNWIQELMLAESGLRFDIDVRDGDQRTAFHWACSSGNVDVAELLLEFGCDIQTQDDAGWSPLHSCASTGQTLILKRILSKGQIDTNTRNAAGSTPLHYASGKGFDEIVEILLQHGAKPDIPDKSGSTPLHRCAINGHAVIAKFLIAAGANVDAQDAEGYSALHLACLERNLRVALVLIHEGKANLNCKAKNGKIPLDFVPEIHRSALLEPLQIYP